MSPDSTTPGLLPFGVLELTIAALAIGELIPEELLEPLQQADLADGAQLRPEVHEQLTAVAPPACLLDLAVATLSGVQLHRFWFAPGLVVCELMQPSGLVGAMTATPAVAMHTLADLVHLGPRPQLDPSERSLTDGVAGLFSLDSAQRTKAAAVVASQLSPVWPRFGESTGRGGWRAVTVTAIGTGVEHPWGISYIETPEGVTAMETSDGTRTAFQPTASGSLWYTLVSRIAAAVTSP